MSLEDGVWKLWRDPPDFSPLDFAQRFTGTFSAHAFRSGLVDELHLLAPIVVGGGKRALADDVELELELLDERRFGSGMIHLCYRTKT
jgi:hypothetical protein